METENLEYLHMMYLLEEAEFLVVMKNYMAQGQNYVMYVYHNGMMERAVNRYLAALKTSWQAKFEEAQGLD